jgi:iron complex transport system permease protein
MSQTSKLSFWVLSFLVLVTAIIGLFLGSYSLDCFEVLRVFTGIGGQPAEPTATYLLWSIRLPRIIMAIVVGSGLSVAGAALQGLFRNPLADPSLLGISSGAMALAALGLTSGSSTRTILSPLGGQLFTTALGFIGGLLAAAWVYRLATRQGQTSVSAMLLAGIAITALAGAITGLALYFADDASLRDITFWTLGSLGGGHWRMVAVLTPIVFVALASLLYQARALDLMSLGEQDAAYAGIDVQAAKRRIIVLSTLIVGACVASTGIISFVALVAPHLVRLLVGAAHRALLPLSAMMGACLLLIADAFARVLVAPAELPLGVLTALLGAPFFLWLLRRSFQTIQD